MHYDNYNNVAMLAFLNGALGHGFFFLKVIFEKSFFKFSCVCLSLEKLVNGKHFLVKEKFGLVSRKVFSWKIWAENTFRKL